jgi:branched-chain amino acid transport system substrate-binding protein
MTAEGMKQAGTTDPTKVKQNLAGTSVKSLFGQNSFRNCNHQATNPVWVGKNVKPKNGTTADVKLLDKTSGKNAIPPCSQVNCNL